MQQKRNNPFVSERALNAVDTAFVQFELYVGSSRFASSPPARCPRSQSVSHFVGDGFFLLGNASRYCIQLFYPHIICHKESWFPQGSFFFSLQFNKELAPSFNVASRLLCCLSFSSGL